MNAKHLILAAVVTVWAGAAAAAIKYGHAEAVAPDGVETVTVPRVVVTAKRADATIARVVVVGRRVDTIHARAAHERPQG